MGAADLYGEVWKHPEYRHVAPGEAHVLRFLELAKPDSRVLDFGAGTGRAAQLIADLSGVPVTGIDFAEGCYDAGISVDFLRHDLTQTLPLKAHYGFCTDVLEHVAPEDVDRVLFNVLESARTVYLAISTVPDHFGPALMGEPLHLTVQPHSWWRAKLEALECRILWEAEEPGVACFLVSAWAKASDIEAKSALNCEESQVEENIRCNLALGLQEVCPHKVQEQPIIVLAGGPSLSDFADEIRSQAAAGVPVVTVNAAYGWALDQGILPAAQVMLDAREFNRRFVERVIPTCRYLMSSQAHHATVAALPREQTWLWHSGDSELVKRMHEHRAMEAGRDHEWYPVFGGTTVMLRALPLLAMLGFRKFDIYGWDSCLRDDAHHAYAQPENDGGRVLEIEVGGRSFRCNGWMAVQANELPRVIRYVLGPIEGLELRVHGDGLIAWILQHGANMATKGN
jgi:SAM-dependent methyltransferase